VDEIKSPLDPLLTISLFFTQRQACLATHSHNNDPTIQLLYAPAKSATLIGDIACWKHCTVK
jgi:hypothetical protein